MNFSIIVGSFGVALLLIAFFLNLFKFVKEDNTAYILLNVLGAALSGYASFLINYMPFVLLESIWCLVALLALAKKMFAGQKS
jgi:uncharacterized protein with PQ loop repeat